MKITLLETSGWYTVFKNLRQSYSLDSRSLIQVSMSYNEDVIDYNYNVNLNNKDLQLLSTLVKKGDSHSKIIRGLQTYVEITAPRYFWQEWLTYVIGVLEINPTIDWVSLNSESTMHTLLKEDLNNADCSGYTSTGIVEEFNNCKYELRFDNNNESKIQRLKPNLPEGYLQTRTFQVSYQAWRRIYQQRHEHKLEEWSKNIVEFIEQLPFAKELITINIEKE